jgi:perosamine synthetase
MTSTTPRIPQVVPWIGDEEKESVARVMEDNWLTEGPRSRAFAEKLNQLIGGPYGVFAPNGTLALALGLMGLGIGPGDEVIVPDCTFAGSATSVLLAGGRPVFVDVEEETFQIDVTRAARAVTAKTKAIMPVHLMGTSADMAGVMAFAARYGLKVIEDAAQGIGVTYRDRHVGSIGDVGCFSFFADKTMTTGEGGFVTCRDEAVYERLRLLRNQGRPHSGVFVHPMVGFNFRITDLQAAIGLAQLAKLPEIIARKTANFALYHELLADQPHVRLLGAAAGSNHVPFRCTLMCDDVAGLSEHLAANQVETRGFFYPLHKQPCFIDLFGEEDDALFPVSMRAYERGMCLPIYPTMAAADIRRIAAVIQSFYE